MKAEPVVDIRDLINEETCIGQVEDFICAICKQPVIEPQKCLSCEWLFCTDCVDGINSHKSKCPIDQTEPFKTTENISRIERNCLNKMQFQCPKCLAKFCYDHGLAHAQQCDRKIDCPAGCGTTVEQTEEKINEHMDKCRKVLLNCECCVPKVILTSATHPCSRKVIK